MPSKNQIVKFARKILELGKEYGIDINSEYIWYVYGEMCNPPEGGPIYLKSGWKGVKVQMPLG